MLQLDENPPAVLPGVVNLADSKGKWRVAHTRSRCEKVLAWDLLRRGVTYFLPMVERVRMSGGRKRHVLHPLFPSYLFFCGDDEARLAAVMTNKATQILEVADEATLVKELSWIKAALESKTELEPYALPATGTRCRITTGPLMGLEGIVIGRNGRTKIVLEVSMLGQGTVLEVDNDLLESVERSQAVLPPESYAAAPSPYLI